MLMFLLRLPLKLFKLILNMILFIPRLIAKILIDTRIKLWG